MTNATAVEPHDQGHEAPAQADDAAAPRPPAGATAPETAGTDWKAEARKWEARAKANSDAAKRLAEIEDANKTELQKAIEARDAAQAAAAQAKAEAARYAVAQSTGVPAEVLTGPGEDLEAYAAALTAWRDDAVKAAQPQPPAPHAGLAGTGADRRPERPSTLTIDEQIAAAEKAGDRDTARTLKALKLSTS